MADILGIIFVILFVMFFLGAFSRKGKNAPNTGERCPSCRKRTLQTEWTTKVHENQYCPSCGFSHIERY